MKYSLVAFLFAAAVFKTAECISCYSCDSESNAGCLPFNSSLVDAVNCDKYYPEASKCIAHTVLIGNYSYTVRSCAYRLDTSNDTISCDYVSNQAAQRNYTVDSCYTCTSNLCNSAMTLFRGNTLGVLLATAIFGVTMRTIL